MHWMQSLRQNRAIQKMLLLGGENVQGMLLCLAATNYVPLVQQRSNGPGVGLQVRTQLSMREDRAARDGDAAGEAEPADEKGGKRFLRSRFPATDLPAECKAAIRNCIRCGGRSHRC